MLPPVKIQQCRSCTLLTLSLLSYVAVVFMVHVPWQQATAGALFPTVFATSDFAMMIVALFGTTISPYLFFWQASQEVEEIRTVPGEVALVHGGMAHANEQLRRIKLDTWIGMGFSNLVAFFITLSTAVTLNVAGITHIDTAAQAAEVLRPLAGELTFLLFAAGIVGTGMLAVPVLAGSAAYAVADSFEWRQGLDRQWFEARRFYALITLATLGGVALVFSPIDPIQALIWSAVINGVIAVPIMAVMMLMAVRPDRMGPFIITRRLKILGWIVASDAPCAVLASRDGRASNLV